MFRVAKQMVRRNRDVVGASCVKGSDGKIVVDEDKLMEIWRAHYDGISNEEFAWDREGLTNVNPVCGPSQGGHRIRISKFPEFSRFSRVFLTIFQAKFIHLFL